MSSSVTETWSPVTQDFGLIQADAKTCATAWAASDPAWKCRDLGDLSLSASFDSLLPLSPAPNVSLFLETRFGWTAYFANGDRGSDPFPPMSRLSLQLGVTAMRVCKTVPTALWPGVIWEVYDGPERGGDEWGYRRSLHAVNDGGRWSFGETGERYPFEVEDHYAARRIRDRFTPKMLDAYLTEMGAGPISDDALTPPGAPARFRVERPRANGLPEISLDEARQRQQRGPA